MKNFSPFFLLLFLILSQLLPLLLVLSLFLFLGPTRPSHLHHFAFARPRTLISRHRMFPSATPLLRPILPAPRLLPSRQHHQAPPLRQRLSLALPLPARSPLVPTL